MPTSKKMLAKARDIEKKLAALDGPEWASDSSDDEAAAPAKPQRNDADKVVDPTKIFVMNLSFDATEAELRAHCSSVGEVASVELLTRGKNQRPSGSAVVEYRYAEAAAAAVQALEGTELDGRALRVRAYFSN